ncbi:hypothetical protein GGTG_02614 [Gaeumannomyces tritici R3-111a-1]|uniref:Uncharacterized protein n=1 Tax=Gaeumannomyces tritici (strain R3-111a-1) TaxID=644352 RepID=J3NMV5_GAET3|nr:hypothetical protein GGTG_02614 [Gaeumannomyces tritici R3-111a-1]EJT77506.1 hypothetical protein GGTG_02614 [Gaeumannomyces tritici R3-111a-1]
MPKPSMEATNPTSRPPLCDAAARLERSLPQRATYDQHTRDGSQSHPHYSTPMTSRHIDFHDLGPPVFRPGTNSLCTRQPQTGPASHDTHA